MKRPPLMSPAEMREARECFARASEPLAVALGLIPGRKPKLDPSVRAEVERFFEARREAMRVLRGAR